MRYYHTISHNSYIYKKKATTPTPTTKEPAFILEAEPGNSEIWGGAMTPVPEGLGPLGEPVPMG
jgi:hypothetical protein